MTIPREVSHALRDLVDQTGGLGNARYRRAFCIALRSERVRIALEDTLRILLEQPPLQRGGKDVDDGRSKLEGYGQ